MYPTAASPVVASAVHRSVPNAAIAPTPRPPIIVTVLVVQSPVTQAPIVSVSMKVTAPRVPRAPAHRDSICSRRHCPSGSISSHPSAITLTRSASLESATARVPLSVTRPSVYLENPVKRSIAAISDARHITGISCRPLLAWQFPFVSPSNRRVLVAHSQANRVRPPPFRAFSCSCVKGLGGEWFLCMAHWRLGCQPRIPGQRRIRYVRAEHV